MRESFYSLRPAPPLCPYDTIENVPQLTRRAALTALSAALAPAQQPQDEDFQVYGENPRLFLNARRLRLLKRERERGSVRWTQLETLVAGKAQMAEPGLAHALYLRGHAFASPEAVEFNDEAMEAIAYYAYEASSDLAAERAPYSSYKGSKWDRGLLPQDTLDLLEKERGVEVEVPRGGKMDWAPLRAKIARQGMRNSNCLAIAPTATISNITATSPCIEPTYKNLFVKSNLSGEFIVLNPFLVKDLKARGLWNQEMIDNLKYFDGELKDIEAIPADLKAKYLTAFDIDPKWIVDAAARRQKWIDQSQSVNLWIKTPDLKTLSHMYRHAWHAGLKTTYYLRSLGASNIEKATVSARKEVRGAAGETAAQTATRNAAEAEVTTSPFPAPAAKKEYTAAEKTACSIEAMRNGGECEACQ